MNPGMYHQMMKYLLHQTIGFVGGLVVASILWLVIL